MHGWVGARVYEGRVSYGIHTGPLSNILPTLWFPILLLKWLVKRSPVFPLSPRKQMFSSLPKCLSNDSPSLPDQFSRWLHTTFVKWFPERTGGGNSETLNHSVRGTTLKEEVGSAPGKHHESRRAKVNTGGGRRSVIALLLCSAFSAALLCSPSFPLYLRFLH